MPRSYRLAEPRSAPAAALRRLPRGEVAADQLDVPAVELPQAGGLHRREHYGVVRLAELLSVGRHVPPHHPIHGCLTARAREVGQGDHGGESIQVPDGRVEVRSREPAWRRVCRIAAPKHPDHKVVYEDPASGVARLPVAHRACTGIGELDAADDAIDVYGALVVHLRGYPVEGLPKDGEVDKVVEAEVPAAQLVLEDVPGQRLLLEVLRALLARGSLPARAGAAGVVGGRGKVGKPHGRAPCAIGVKALTDGCSPMTHRRSSALVHVDKHHRLPAGGASALGHGGHVGREAAALARGVVLDARAVQPCQVDPESAA
mmetsp:Transcript_35030/g.94941  ORF Transcript_35030/g.94941 Transcript_35030/m.94941 type:complete len:317 (-) Transcript_35030:38-988(-)|eukprot:CAMPEP_0171255426 /NCGR_PEP_ID=MMETSP0790-20130122/52764_1 /TAXON_ID=2925 /ORGANISM="Alexandrium catenella, Strain OF101" /LENGTH=316 /DNA_ID=CAMNT_0011723385 /DNA_START=136 /DNA_END=1086 /DNA_ORIENTATION=-